MVTTRSSESLAGLTVNAFASVSLEPPLVLICIDLHSHVLASLRTSGTFVVNILTSEQGHFSRCFASSSQERYEHFCRASYHNAATGSPVLDDALAFIDTRVVAEYPGGDHAIFLGQVIAMGTHSQIAFATEADEQHWQLSRITKAPARMAQSQYLLLTRRNGRWSTIAHSIVTLLPPIMGGPAW